MPTLMTGKNPKSGREETIPVSDCFIKSRLEMGYKIVAPTDEAARAATARLIKAPSGPGAKFTGEKAGATKPEPVPAEPAHAPAAAPAADPETAAQRHARKNGTAAPAAEPGKE